MYSIYNSLYEDALRRIKTDTYEVDPFVFSPQDNRKGLSLIIKPPSPILEALSSFLDELSKIDPKQYYYTKHSIHFTLLTIISCYDGFNKTAINPTEYFQVIADSLSDISPFKVDIKGIGLSSATVLAKGFEQDNKVENARNKLRAMFSQSHLQQSIDQRYLIKTFHATLARFTIKIKPKAAFLALIKEFENYNFGSFEVNEIDLVYNDWYHRPNQVEVLERFILKG